MPGFASSFSAAIRRLPTLLENKEYVGRIEAVLGDAGRQPHQFPSIVAQQRLNRVAVIGGLRVARVLGVDPEVCYTDRLPVSGHDDARSCVATFPPDRSACPGRAGSPSGQRINAVPTMPAMSRFQVQHNGMSIPSTSLTGPAGLT